MPSSAFSDCSHRPSHSICAHAVPMRQVYLRVNARTVYCLIIPRHTVIEQVGGVPLVRRCRDKKQAEGSPDSPQNTAHVAILRKRIIDGGSKGEREVHSSRRRDELVNETVKRVAYQRDRRYDVDTYDLRSSSNYLAPMGKLMHGVEHQCVRESSVAMHECPRARAGNRTNLLGP